jgi:hypothetical protein
MRTPRASSFLLLVSILAVGTAACGGGETETADSPGQPGAGGSASGGKSGAGGSASGGKAGAGGTAGTGGKAGASGAAGASGKAGASGASGKAGASGAAGAAGAGGKAGSGGTAGSSGTAGASGKAGSSGMAGAGGAAGSAGASGQGGASGTAGAGASSGNGGAGAGGEAGEAGAGGSSGAGAGGAGASGAAGSGGATPCADVSECPASQNPCLVPTCDAGLCAEDFIPADAPTSSQTAGDCATTQCDGAGNVVSIVDDADLPDDGSPCTDDVCVAGVPSNPKVATGTACSQNGGAVCDDAGSCVECVTANDCPGADSECQSRTCTAGVCGVSFQPAGVALASQTAGDCKREQCDGAGSTAQVSDDLDVPIDSNPCTDDVCAAGVASNPPVGEGAACGANGLCDASGVCQGCLTANDCPGADSECQTRTCTAGACGVSFTPAGTAVAAQTDGDCKKNQCDGAGSLAVVPDGTDLPVDGNACTTDVCTAGVPSNPPVSLGTSCTGGVCNAAGACVGCLTAATCPGSDTACQSRTCIAGACGVSLVPAGTATASQTAGDCKKNQCDGAGAIVSVADNADVPVDSNQCTADVCTAGVPSNPPLGSGAACTQNGGAVCSGSGTCVQCVVASTCPGADTACQTRTCNSGTCGFSFTAAGTATASQTAGDCKKNQCDGAGAIVTVADNADVPVDSNTCTSDVCTAGVPSNPPLASGAACGSNGLCNGSGVCVGCLAPSDCPGTDTECQSRTCTAGMCGFSFVAAGTATASQAAGDCKKNQCDGAGAIVNVADNADVPVDSNQCTADVCTAGVPSNPPLGSGAACTQNGGAVCSGSGTCVQCVVASTCPGADTACQTRTCNSGTCGFSFTAAGTATASQTAGDCKKNQCDGAGAIVNVADNADVPVDSNQCTGDVCTAGVPSNPALPVGTACTQSGGTACDNTATCGAPPTVASATPTNGTNALATSDVVVTFSAAMNPATLSAQGAAGPCSGSLQVSLDNFATCIALPTLTVAGGNTTATLQAAPGLLVNRTYKIRVTTAATSAKGLPLAATFTQAAGFTTTSPNTCNDSLVISQVYGGGGSGTATFKSDYVELHNRGTTAISLLGKSIQYGSSGGSTWNKSDLPGDTIPAGGYYLVQMSAGTGLADLSPAADFVSATSIAMSGSAGKIALVDNTTALSGACPLGPTVLDFVGYGGANCSEGGSPTAGLSTTTAALRVQAGCGDGDVNGLDFAVLAPAPRNSGTAPSVCSCLVQNESNAGAEADYCVTQFPLSLSVATGATSALVYGQLFESGVTETAGANSNVRAQLGYGPATTNPQYDASWKWAPASFNVQTGNNDEYQASFVAPAVGSYRYAYRFSVDNGVSWTTCDNNVADSGAGSNASLTFELKDLAILTVTP